LSVYRFAKRPPAESGGTIEHPPPEEKRALTTFPAAGDLRVMVF
jgi:hypothetical protein